MALSRIALVAFVLAASVAHAQPTSDVLRDGNAAASTGDWQRVTALVEPLLRGQLPKADLAEAHRLAGLAAFFQGQEQQAKMHFLEYLRLDPDGSLDPALYPPDVRTAFDKVKIDHQGELRELRPKQHRYFLLNLIPPGGQIQNGESTKAIVLGSLLGVFAVGNVTSYLVLRSWCRPVSGEQGSSVICDDEKNRNHAATQLRTINIASGVGLILAYAYGVYDGVTTYRRRTRELAIQPFINSVSGGSVFGIGGSF